MVELNEFQSVLHRSASASDIARMVIDLGTVASKVNDCWLVCQYVVWLETAESCRRRCILLCPGRLPSLVLFCFQINNTTDSFGSIWRLKRNPMKQWKVLQTASKCSLTSLKDWTKFESRIDCAIPWGSFPRSWKKWLALFGDGLKTGNVCVHSSSSGRNRDWLVGSSQVYLCWLSKGESNWVEGQNRYLQGQVRPRS